MEKLLLVPLAAAALTLCSVAQAVDWPEWRGPNKDGRIEAAGSPDRWQVENATTLWKTNIGKGYSSISLANGNAYTLGHDDNGHETIFCFDAVTGATKWSHVYAADLIPSMHVGGPNATPTIQDGMLYSMSKDGQVLCLNAKSGDVEWQANLGQVLDIDIPTWGFACSPRVLGDSLILMAGKTVAFDLKTGAVKWTSADTNQPGYATSVAFEDHGKSLVAALDGNGFSILDATSGKQLARRPFITKYDMTSADPILLEDSGQFFITAVSKGELLKWNGSDLEEVWSTKDMRNSLHASIEADGYIYGVDGSHMNKRSKLTCMRLSDGEVMWTEDNYGYASLIAVNDTLVILTEGGELVTAPISPEGYSEISRKKLFNSICWTPPSFADGKLYMRDDYGSMVCLQLP